MADNSSTNGARLLDAASDYSPGSTALDQIRRYLAELAGVLEQHPEPGLYLPEAQWRLDELIEELAHNRPSAPRVQARWIRLEPVLREVQINLPLDDLTVLIKKAVGVS